jgi:predicted SnoaL-like aldol condensation-catalyzing enzyme
MKRLLVILTVIEVIVACRNKNSNNSSNDSATQQNLQAVHKIAKAFETGDTALINQAVAEDFIDHKDVGDVKGIDNLKAFVLASHQHIKNLEMETVKELADNEYVMSWTEFKGTGDGQGGTAQGDFNVRGVEITRCKNGKAIEHWEAMDMRDVAKMMQQVMPVQDSSLTDSTKAE